ncbi:MAG: NAD(P)H-dependent glycerol-3-phosphate dehydrogenase [Oscillospiraceae bacterium]
MAKIMILGSGGFGTSLAVTLHKSGHDVILWSYSQAEIDQIRLHGENKKLLPGICVDMSIELTTNIELVNTAEIVIFAVPSRAVASVASKTKDYISEKSIVCNVGKGFDPETNLRLSQVIKNQLPNNDVVILSGPSHAEEIARGIPTTIVAACENKKSALKIQEVLMNTNLRIYVSDDIIGVEVGGALKNIIAVCAGICDGMELGDNTKAALITRGLAEIARLGKAMGAKSETFTGLSGMGDLIVTCTSMHSRNRRYGIFVGQGLSSADALARVGMTVEGCDATISAYNLAKKYNVEMPITNELYSVLTENKSPRIVVEDLMSRPKKNESEDVSLLH